jgi:hypothetical protein
MHPAGRPPQSVYVVPSVVPTPTLSTNVVSSTEIDLTANYVGPPSEALYFFYVGPSATGPWTLINGTGQQGSFCPVTGLQGSTPEYFYCYVQTVDGRQSPNSAVVSATTAAEVSGIITTDAGAEILTDVWDWSNQQVTFNLTNYFFDGTPGGKAIATDPE